MQGEAMSKNHELDVLAKLFSKLSDEEREELLDLAKNTKTTKKDQPHNKFFDMDLSDEDMAARETSKKLNKTASKNNKMKRPPIKMLKVSCKNCGKEFEIPENHPSRYNFICCV